MSAMWSIVFDERGPSARRARECGASPQASSWHRSRQRAVARRRAVRCLRTGTAAVGARYADRFGDGCLSSVCRAVSARGENCLLQLIRRNWLTLFGIRQEIIPASLGPFEAYMNRMLVSDEITVGPMAKSLAHDVLYPRPWIFKPGGPLFRFVTAGLLPEKTSSRLRSTMERTERKDVQKTGHQ